MNEARNVVSDGNEASGTRIKLNPPEPPPKIKLRLGANRSASPLTAAKATPRTPSVAVDGEALHRQQNLVKTGAGISEPSKPKPPSEEQVEPARSVDTATDKEAVVPSTDGVKNEASGDQSIADVGNTQAVAETPGSTRAPVSSTATAQPEDPTTQTQSRSPVPSSNLVRQPTPVAVPSASDSRFRQPGKGTTDISESRSLAITC